MAQPTANAKVDRLAVDFANTVACPGCRGADAFGSAQEARRWIRRKLPGTGAPVGPSDVRALRRFRDEVRRVLQATVDSTQPPLSAVETINRAATRSPSRWALRWTPGHWSVEERGTELAGAQRVISLTARSLIDLLGKAPAPVRRCEGPGCIHFLVAHRSQQRWCSPTGCGNRARVQRHYRKVRSRPKVK
jgi:predicted RNA-binding Zn ribbon-like protein